MAACGRQHNTLNQLIFFLLVIFCWQALKYIASFCNCIRGFFRNEHYYCHPFFNWKLLLFIHPVFQCGKDLIGGGNSHSLYVLSPCFSCLLMSMKIFHHISHVLHQYLKFHFGVTCVSLFLHRIYILLINS